jgi:hypothetical protein
MSYDKERAQLFIDDVKKLRVWNASPSLSPDAMRDISNILFRWLFDKHPMLQDICDEAKLPLLLPVPSDKAAACNSTAIKLKPDFYLCSGFNTQARFGARLASLTEYSQSTVLHIQGRNVTVRDLVAMVRNKLGGGHYDPVERKKWQKDLLRISDALFIAHQKALNHAMKQILTGILEALDG